VENRVAPAANCTFFNGLLLFALFWCSHFLHGVSERRGRESERKACEIRAVRQSNEEMFAELERTFQFFTA